MAFLDLHMHTVYSDGSSTPEELVTACAAQKLKAIAVTDHDTVASLPFIQETGDSLGLEIIPGIEINTFWERPSGKLQEVHVLGYFIDPEGELIQDIIKAHSQARIFQIQEMVTRLKSQARISLDFDDIQQNSGLGTLGRPHVAKAIVAKGGAQNISDAFARYLQPHCSTFVRRKTVTPHEAVEAIYDAGGIPVIAHPGEMEGIENLTIDLMNYGLRGLEAYHRSHSPGVIEFHCSLAERHGLVVTGGTDFHGTSDVYAKSLERLHMPSYVYDELMTEHHNRKRSLFKAS